MTEIKIELILIDIKTTIKEAMAKIGISTGRVLYVVDIKKKLLGTLSDGDIRKWILYGGQLSSTVEKAYNKNPVYVERDYTIQDVRKIMLERCIESIPVVNKSKEIIEILLWDNILSQEKEILQVKQKLDIQVVIMAGGLGTRLDPFTKVLPKPLIPIDGKPIIEIIMDKFSQYGIDEYFLCVNYKSRMIKYYFQDTNTDKKVYFSEEEKPLGTIGGLKYLESKLKDNFIVTNCDILIHSDYSEIVKAHYESKRDLTLVASCRNFIIPYGVCDIESGGELIAIKEKPEYDMLVNTGMYIMNKKLLKLIPKNQVFNINEFIVEAKKKDFKVGIFPINEQSWVDVGQWEEYHKATKSMRTK